MNKLLLLPMALVVASACAEMRPDGHFGKRLDKMLANHVEATDPVKLAALYREETKGHWQTEFWGKYMHAAAPFARYTGSERLGAKIAASTQAIIGSQEPGGYIGNYAPANRYSRGGRRGDARLLHERARRGESSRAGRDGALPPHACG